MGPAADREPRYLVLVDGSPASTGLVRETWRMAGGCPWVAVYLDVSKRAFFSRAEETRLSANLRLVERLGGDLVCFEPDRGPLGRELLELARARRATHVVIGHPGRWKRPWPRLGTLAEVLAEGDVELVIHVVPPRHAAPPPLPPARTAGLEELRQLGLVLPLVAAATGIGYAVFHFLGLADVMMVYMLCITVAATRFGRHATLLASVLSILALDFCFIEPRYSFVLTDIQHIGTFAVMMGVGWVILGLAEHIRAQARLAQERERHSRTLYRAGAVLAEGGSVEGLRRRIETYLARELELPAAVLLNDTAGALPEPDSRFAPGTREAARAALEHGAPAGPGTGFLPHAPSLLLPLAGTERPVGVLALQPEPGSAFPQPGHLDLLIPLAAQVSLALERAIMAEERTRARIRADHEALRSSLLSSISHDLRSPLGTITGATTTLLDPGPEAAPGDQRILLNTIHQESRRLLRMVNNLLDLTKLESGQVQVKKEWAAIEEVVGSAIGHLEEQFEARPLTVELPEIWVPMDPLLFEQALLNVLDNALKYSPPGTPIGIRGWAEDEAFFVEVADAGPGIVPGEEELIFEKLYRGSGGGRAQGAGLGLAICRGILQAHDGSIQARTGSRGGARVTMKLPLAGSILDDAPPDLKPDPAL